ncbi:uncharacterized protein K452DRAFT_348245 [Aplosporella prunicola CBS 121167]|uniref:REJ domain-containing protein n=1 Tax=Aplosporella prunicola CBS 121167 TaxID=1176127 RepID=A0A6A6BR06_9PEZI|nr:uncharacterized protein K452DRAFT_348245 [Aplosporella prunicola CBS 121167]KAF2146440.1 hypothetical protein K452DRAFT_348245 [Aplosporella prunicola CBS 121167]
MSPSNMELPDRVRSHGHTLASLQQTSAPGRPRSDDSWIEVSSQPSSSSLSSANDEIITDGLRVQHDSNAHRRRRRRLDPDLGYRGSSAGTSSQEEYEESESESDRVMSSSNEGLPPAQEVRRLSRVARYSSSDNHSDMEASDDEDENSTAVGYIPSTENCFTPQPTAFSHPRTARQQQSQRHSYPSQNTHSPYNMISPTHQADHDAALRASLSTLLSCAAAARGLPKSRTTTLANPAAAAPSSSRVDPATLRMVPESVALGSGAPSPPTAPQRPTPTSTPSGGTIPPASTRSSSGSQEKHKRARPSSKDRRGSAKKRRASAFNTNNFPSAAAAAGALDSEAPISPTLLTWVVSAGVVVLVSALSFSAGYVVGRDAGRAEVELLGELRPTGTTCAGEALSRSAGGLRRLRLPGAAAAGG